MSFPTLLQNTFYNELFAKINSYVYNSVESSRKIVKYSVIKKLIAFHWCKL